MSKPKRSATQVKATKPTPLLFKPVKLQYLKFFKALGSAVKDLNTQQWPKVVSDAVDLAGSVTITSDSPEELAYVLLQRSVLKALFVLVGENNLRDLATSAGKVESVEKTIEETLVSEEVSLDRHFFDRPMLQTFLAPLQEQLKQWLLAYGVSQSAAQNIANRLPSHFAHSLTEEWRRNAARYKPILDALDSPFAQANDRELGWINYHALLQQQIDESIFEEPFSLSQIYIPLNAYYWESESKRKEKQKSETSDQPRTRFVVSLEEELLHWIDTPHKNDLLRVISGGPGSGKSSFAKIFAAKVSAAGKVKVLFVPLHLIDADKDFCSDLTRYIQDEGILSSDPFDSKDPEPDLLVILDGLDELATQGKAAAETARKFIGEIERTLVRRNQQKVQLRILLSGRELVIQENETEFRQARQLLTILPYHLPEAERPKDLYTDPKELLESDLRDRWWKTYGELTGKRDLTELPKSLQREGLNEVTAQPLLNYLVALSFVRGKVQFDDSVNLNLVYGDLVDAVQEGGHNNKRQHPSIRAMGSKKFRLVLEEIALAAWHGDGRTTTVREIQEHCKTSGLGKLLEQFRVGAEAGVTRLLAAFFFRRHGQRSSGDETFIFTHRSFGEYLTACRIVRGVEKMAKEIQERKTSLTDGWNERDALKHWADLCGPSPCTLYIKKFVLGEFRRRQIEKASESRIILADLFSHLLIHGLPMEKIAATDFPLAMQQSRNAEETLLVALNAAAVATETVAPIHRPENSQQAFGAWFRRIQGQRTGPDSCLASHCLSYLELSHSILDISDLYGSNLSHSNLSAISGYFADLQGADLQRADLQGADLQGAKLQEAKLQGANLQEAKLQGANLQGANLQGANLQGANLQGANLWEAKLQGAKLQGARLQGAKLQGSIYNKKDLAGADLEGVIFE